MAYIYIYIYYIYIIGLQNNKATTNMFDELDNEVARFLSAPAFNEQTKMAYAPSEHTAWREQLQGKTHPQKMQAYVVQQERLQEEILNKSLNRNNYNNNDQMTTMQQSQSQPYLMQQSNMQQQQQQMSLNNNNNNNTNIVGTGNKSVQLIRAKRQRRRQEFRETLKKTASQGIRLPRRKSNGSIVN